MDYLKLLEHSYEDDKTRFFYDHDTTKTRLAYLAESIFGILTYDSGKDEFFGGKAVEVCAAINNGKTFEYIEDADNYTWYIAMCNIPFFAERLEWGTSIRGAWWGARPGHKIEFYSSSLTVDDAQLTEPLEFTDDEWKLFIAAIIEFANVEVNQA